MESMKL